MATKKKVTDKDLKAARADLDKARSRNDPHPERVLAAFMGWKEGILDELHRAKQLASEFNLTGSRHEWRPGFEFMADLTRVLDEAGDALEHMPGMDYRDTSTLEREIGDMLAEEAFHRLSKKAGAA